MVIVFISYFVLLIIKSSQKSNNYFSVFDIIPTAVRNKTSNLSLFHFQPKYDHYDV
ncbi:hypothetical protein FHW89_003885 [Mucilaginibacter sp. SG564]|nr:hypothetical protein [Mucilaginibacter sp. SG564]